MNRTTLASAAGLLLSAAAIFGGCDTRIEESPTEVVEQRAERTIREAGGDPSDWIIEGSCIGMGPCSATAFAAEFANLELARSTYTVRDSRAFPVAPDGIAEAAARAVDGDCFDRASTSEALETCVVSGRQ